MTNNTRILHARGFTLKAKQAMKAVAEGAAVWVEYGVSIRQATIEESIARRNQQAKERDPLPNAEIPGLTFQPPANAIKEMSEMYQLVQQANAFIAQAQ